MTATMIFGTNLEEIKEAHRQKVKEINEDSGRGLGGFEKMHVRNSVSWVLGEILSQEKKDGKELPVHRRLHILSCAFCDDPVLDGEVAAQCFGFVFPSNFLHDPVLGDLPDPAFIT